MHFGSSAAENCDATDPKQAGSMSTWGGLPQYMLASPAPVDHPVPRRRSRPFTLAGSLIRDGRRHVLGGGGVGRPRAAWAPMLRKPAHSSKHTHTRRKCSLRSHQYNEAITNPSFEALSHLPRHCPLAIRHAPYIMMHALLQISADMVMPRDPPTHTCPNVFCSLIINRLRVDVGCAERKLLLLVC